DFGDPTSVERDPAAGDPVRVGFFERHASGSPCAERRTGEGDDRGLGVRRQQAHPVQAARRGAHHVPLSRDGAAAGLIAADACSPLTTHFDAIVEQGFYLVGGTDDPGFVHGVQEMEFVKTAGGGLLHKVRDGKTSALIVNYSVWHVIPIPTGYRGGGISPHADV